MVRYYLVYKPYGMVCQFSEAGDKPVLSLLGGLPGDVYPVGRLDADSEGLLLITNDKALNQRLLNPSSKVEKVYLVQVEGLPAPDAIQKLASGVDIRVNDKSHRTLPAKVKLVPEPQLPARYPPIRYRAAIPTAWLRIAINEGKNRQVRRMTAAVGHPTLRLVRYSLGPFTIVGMQPGDVNELSRSEFYNLLNTFVSN